MIETRNIKNLLSQVKTIVTSFERVAQATGENFNIFSVLNIEHYEVGTHSKFIAHLLNPKGKHGLGSRFLVLFLNEIGAREHLDIETTSCKIEHFIGKKIIEGKNPQGGQIDIYLWDKKGKSISIENKIYASDEEKQIVRYYNYKKNNLVFYLTLDGRDASKFSRGALKSNFDNKTEDIHFYCISYEKTILEWIEKCEKETSEVPILRETIKQYKNLIKKLTHQNINSEMNEEIIQLILDNQESTKSIIKSVNSLRNKINRNLVQIERMSNEKYIENLNGNLKTINQLYHITKVKKIKYKNRELVNFDLYLDKDETSTKRKHFCLEYSNFDFGIRLQGWSLNEDIKSLVLKKYSKEVSKEYSNPVENDVDTMIKYVNDLVLKIAKYLNENRNEFESLT